MKGVWELARGPTSVKTKHFHGMLQQHSRFSHVCEMYVHRVTSEPHSIRITNHGKIKSWVDFSLNFLKVNPFFLGKFRLLADHGEKEQ